MRDFFEFPVIVVFGLLCAVAVFLCSIPSKEDKLMEKLYAECIADGRKEYECYAMMKRIETTYMPIPMAVPVR